MSFIVFLIVLALLIFVHELGHFIAAKSSGIRVDEFSIGFPPRIGSFKPKKGETRYSLGAIPFGGFVKIYGEDPTEKIPAGQDEKRSLIKKPKRIQLWVLAAGVLGNIIFAWLLISLGFIGGLPASVEFGQKGIVENPAVTITGIFSEPASSAGFQVGDKILSARAGSSLLEQEEVTKFSVQELIAENEGNEITFLIRRGEEDLSLTAIPEAGVLEEQAAIGISIDAVGIVKLPIHIAFLEGMNVTAGLVVDVAIGLSQFFAGAITGSANFLQIAGPVGIVGLIGDASELGFMYLVSFTAFISINLALINLIPVPALDGGRILFVIIEAIKGSPINPRVAHVLNTVGFAFLILLLAVVTYNDIVRIFASS